MQKSISSYYFKSLEDAIPCIVHPDTEFVRLFFSQISDCVMKWNKEEEKVQYMSCTRDLVDGSGPFRITKVFFTLDELKEFPGVERIMVRNQSFVNCGGEREVKYVVDHIATLEFMGDCVVLGPSSYIFTQSGKTVTLQENILRYNPNLSQFIGQIFEVDMLETPFGEVLSSELVKAYDVKRDVGGL